MTQMEQLYRDMLRIRLVEERIAEEYPKQEMRCPVHLSIGQEAVAVGVCSQLGFTDEIMSGHRSHAHYLAKGGSMKRMIAELMGRQSGCAFGFGGSMHLIDRSCGFRGAVPIVGSTIPIATGLSFQHSLDQDGKIVATFLGEGATEEGVFSESLTFASLKSLPIIYVVEDNLYSVYSPKEVRQSSSRSIVKIAEAHGVKAYEGDGNCVEEVARLSQEAVTNCRKGRGPVLLKLDTYRWREHCGPNYDNDIGYRSENEYLSWKSKCPIQRVSLTLSDTYKLGVKETIEQEIDDAFAWARSQPMANVPNLKDFVYA